MNSRRCIASFPRAGATPSNQESPASEMGISLRRRNPEDRMTEMGQERRFGEVSAMSVLPLKSYQISDVSIR
jgi:hypothetical protein